MTYTRGKGRSQSSSSRAGGTDRDDLNVEVTNLIMECLKKGDVPWHRPWKVGAGGINGLPISMSTRKPYRGINPLLLGFTAAAKGYTSPWWGTWNKIATLDGVDVKDKAARRAWTGLRGQKSTTVIYWRRLPIEKENPLTGKKERIVIPFAKSFNVFNLEQVAWERGAPAFLTKVEEVKPLAARLESAELIIKGYPNPPTYVTGDAAYYQDVFDRITLPPFESFDSPQEYYSTAFHEAAHSTGHEKRLNVKGVAGGTFDGFGSESYSREELRAEMAAALLCATAGIDMTVTLPNSAAYLSSWLRQLGEDPKLILQVAWQAQKAVDHILGVSYETDSEDTD